MTIAIALKVHDGVVLVADSATTLAGGGQVFNVYDNANKIFNLHRGLPIGAMTWGIGSIGPASIATLAKDLRRRLMGQDQDHFDWKLNEEAYTVEEVATRLREFFYEEQYKTHNKDKKSPAELGLLVAGYSAKAPLAETWQVRIMSSGECDAPEQQMGPEASGISPRGQPEAVSRLYQGFSPLLEQALRKLGAKEEAAKQMILALRQQLRAQLLQDAMPIQDVIDLGIFLADTTVGFTKYMPGANTVGGPIEVAAITKHEGFRWVRRKHYFKAALNPTVPD